MFFYIIDYVSINTTVERVDGYLTSSITYVVKERNVIITKQLKIARNSELSVRAG